MIGSYDYVMGKCLKFKIVYDKLGVDDFYDNFSIVMDGVGYIWVFVSGRGKKRLGFKFCSKKLYNID